MPWRHLGQNVSGFLNDGAIKQAEASSRPKPMRIIEPHRMLTKLATVAIMTD